MAAGSITEKLFLREATRLVQKSRTIGDTWQIIEPGDGDTWLPYLVKKSVVRLRTTQSKTPVDLSSTLKETEYYHDAEDDDHYEATESPADGVVCSIEHHILYSTSFGVPVLYFNAYKPDGGLVELEMLWDTLPEWYQHRLREDRWTFLTQQEHPVLMRPFFQLHPCHTQDFMEKIQFGTPSTECLSNPGYLITWLSTVGPVVHLHIPMKYALDSL